MPGRESWLSHRDQRHLRTKLQVELLYRQDAIRSVHTIRPASGGEDPAAGNQDHLHVRLHGEFDVTTRTDRAGIELPAEALHAGGVRTANPGSAGPGGVG